MEVEETIYGSWNLKVGFWIGDGISEHRIWHKSEGRRVKGFSVGLGFTTVVVNNVENGLILSVDFRR